MRILYLLSGIILFCSCLREAPNTYDGDTTDIMAYVPVYARAANAGEISVKASQPTVNAGKIYAYGHYIFQNDLNLGIHIIDNSNTASPRKVAFLNIPYNTELAVKGNYIYANNVSDLLVIDIHDPLHPSVIRKVPNAFPLIDQEYPPQSGKFVCPDTSEGIVVAWEFKTVQNADCRK